MKREGGQVGLTRGSTKERRQKSSGRSFWRGVPVRRRAEG
jgi:hypothetical protein